MSEVSNFYAGTGGLVEAISSALDVAGIDRAALRPSDLAAVDEFHIRGRAATLEIIEALGLTADSNVLDLGSGLGGPARTLAEVTGCEVTGVDLTPEFCDVATALSEWTGLSGRTRFQVGDATATGLPDSAVGRSDDRARRDEHPRQGRAVRRSLPRAPSRRQVRRVRRPAG